jgi:hypothetical protein
MHYRKKPRAQTASRVAHSSAPERPLGPCAFERVLRQIVCGLTTSGQRTRIPPQARDVRFKLIGRKGRRHLPYQSIMRHRLRPMLRAECGAVAVIQPPPPYLLTNDAHRSFIPGSWCAN